MIDRKKLRKKIPAGYCRVIAEKAGVSTVSVSRYFSGKTNSESIELAALEVAAEVKQAKQELLKAIYE